MDRLSGKKLSLWSRIKRLALTDVRALARGLNADDLEQIEQVLIEADFGVPATIDLMEFLEGKVRQGALKTDRRPAGGARRAPDDDALRQRRSRLDGNADRTDRRWSW